MASQIDLPNPITSWLAAQSVVRRNSSTGKRTLMEMDPNIVHTPAKRAKHTGFADTDATPRPPSPSANQEVSHVPLLSSSLPAPFLPRSPRSTSASSKRSHRDANSDTDSERHSSRSQASTRSQSPQKRMASRQFAHYPVRAGMLGDWAKVPQDVRRLAKYFKHLKQGTAAILPTRCNSDEFRIALSEGDAEEDERLFATLFDASRDADAVPYLTWAEKLVAQTRRNKARVVSEAHWNSDIHHHVLDTALEYSRFRDRLMTDNISAATISPSLLAQDSLQSCKIDFCISLQLDASDQRRLDSTGVSSLNHTAYWPIRYNPIAINIESKADRGGAPTAKLQLSTWMQAQIFKLRTLLHRAGNPHALIPPIPQVLVEGDSWTFWCFQDEGSEHGVGDSAEGTFYSDGFEFGSTATMLGCYQVLAGLQHLLNWAETEWRTWYEQEILNPTLSR